jgi:PAS domain S-box-containing protein
VIRVLIVDDKDENLDYLGALLGGNGMHVQRARHGAEALALAAAGPPDLVISDLLMPVMDGYTLLRYWKSDTRLRAIPFMVYTSTYTNPEDERLAMNLGANAFLLKPAEPHELLARIERTLSDGTLDDTASRAKLVVTETVVLREYNEALIRKLEDKTQQLERMNQQLQREVVKRSEIARTQVGILNALSAQVALIDARGVIVAINESWRNMAETASTRVAEFGVGKRYIDVCTSTALLSAEDASLADAGIRGVLRGKAKRFAMEYDAKGASPARWVEMVVTPLNPTAGSGAVIMHMDITERKDIEQRLFDSQQQYLLLLNSTAEGIYGLDVDGLCTFCNPAAARMLGVSDPSEFIGQHMHERVHHTYPDGRPYPTEECKVYRAFHQGRGSHAEDEVFFRADGSKFPAEYWSFPIRRSGKIVGAVVTFLDISERRSLEAQFLQAQKMEAIGRLAGGVAHDFNNALQVVMTCSELLDARLAPQDDSRKLTREIRLAGQRGASLTRQLLAFSRKPLWRPSVLDLNEAVREIEAMCRLLIGDELQFRVSCKASTPRVTADQSQIEQLIMNLVVNAKDATAAGGEIWIRTANVEISEDDAKLSAYVGSGSYVALTISDNGCGMDASTQARMFEPFFTTKDIGKGTGIGLSTVYGIVKQSGAGIQVESAPGKGTKIQVYFPVTPVVSDALSAQANVTPIGVGVEGRETVLLVEGEDALRGLMRASLEVHGYTVIAADLGKSAVELCQGAERHISLLLIDAILPDLSGPEVVRQVLAADPSIRVLYMSGRADDYLIRSSLHGTNMLLLEKPFTADQLLRSVRAVLDAHQAVGPAAAAAAIQ